MPPAVEAPTHLSGGKPAEWEDFLLARRYRVAHELAPAEGRVLLDFGCGNGAQTVRFAADFPVLLAVDVQQGSLVSLQRARDQLHGYENVHPLRYDGDLLPLADTSVDRVISFEVLEHVRDDRSALQEIHRVLRPGGTLVMSVPNRWWIFETHGADLPLLPWNRVPFFSWLPKAIHDRWARARIYRRREIARLVREAGFEVERSAYITAPMDVVRIAWLQRLLRSTLFRPDLTRVPVLSTAVLVVARRSLT